VKGSIQPGDLLILAAAHHVRYIGKAGLMTEWPDAQKKCQCVGELIAIRPSRFIRGEVLMCYMNAPAIRAQVRRLVRGMSAHLYPTDLRELPVPKIEETIQDQIAILIHKSFAARKDTQAMLATAKRAVEIAIEDNEPAALRFLKEARE